MAEASTALVTGSARRLGRAIAAALVEDGWRVVIHSSDLARSQATCEELGAAGALAADLRNPVAARSLPSEAAALLGGQLDLLVNNAGTFVHRPVLETSLEDWREAFDVNARAPFLLMQAAAELLARTRGCVINISDHAATEHWATYAAHSASKAALESLTLSTAKALAPDVRVNAISPGAVLPPDDASAELLARLAQRGVGSPDQVVHALRELLRDPSRTGEIVVL